MESLYTNRDNPWNWEKEGDADNKNKNKCNDKLYSKIVIVFRKVLTL